MALFSRKTKKDQSAQGGEASQAAPVISGAIRSAAVLRSPRITEKASFAMESFVYVFEVAPEANKKQVAAAIQSIYKVKPVKVAIVVNKPKVTRSMRTGAYGTKGGYKKAYVYLKKGESITVT